ncbi:hypothetical protein K2173_003972 [Erythroxylum novogranatense]|uniref:Uncharacterized protein n=1 Tax=Erythroxylum novogranatense TaxID=1862640 RepID=A0AAV8SJ85_9ROSI|nr:hypothetical protein K2173_003972 [Erythroxylum novogranatense]
MASILAGWLDFHSTLRSSITRWPHLVSVSTSFVTPRWVSDPRRLLRLPELGMSIVDDVIWSVVTAFESVALVSMLCFFFLFCGCTV